MLCYICKKVSSDLTDYRHHLIRHRVLGETVVPFVCGQDGCKSTFSKLYNLLRHLKMFHDTSDESSMCSNLQETMEIESTVADDQSTATCELPFCSTSTRESISDIKAEGEVMVAALRANSSVPYAVVECVVDHCNQIAETAVHSFQNATLNSLQAAGLENDVIEKVQQSMHSQKSLLKCPLGFLSTRYKQDKHFDSHPLAVKPQTITLGSRIDVHASVSHIAYDSFQYVSIEETIRSLLQNRAYVEALFVDKCSPGIIAEWQDGLHFAHHQLISDKSKLALMIQIFYDGMGTVNPLRGQSTMYNVGVFYFIVKNLPNVYNSSSANVHLLALCNSNELKRYSFDPVLRKVVDELKQLSTVGFSGEFPIIGTRQIYVCLGQVACDNLALNSIFGFVECFSVDFFCTMCYATQMDIQSKFYEHEFERRTIISYNRDLDKVTDPTCDKSNVFGVKRACLLNELPGFHITTNYSLDVMHIILEGIVPVELGCIMYTLCTVKHYFSLAEFRSRVHSFWGHINVDKGNKPPEINAFEKPNHRICPSMTALQMWSLLKYLPLLVGDRVPNNDENWLFLLQLSELVDLLFAPKFTHGMVSYLREIIAEHLQLFKQLYSSGKNPVSLKPKHHLLVHLPSVILNSGPLVGMSCLRYEMKNSFFKRCAHTMGNFINPCLTLAKRQQQHALMSKLYGEQIRNVVCVKRHDFIPIFTLHCSHIVCEKFGLEETDDVAVAKQLSRASVTYKSGQHVVIDVNAEGDLVFGKIEFFVSMPNSCEWYIVVNEMTTKQFDTHYHCFVIEYNHPAQYKLMTLENLLDGHAVCCYATRYSRETVHFVRLPYHVFKL